MAIKRAVLVYQAGIANVFAVDHFSLTDATKRNARRLRQHAFSSCVPYAQGLLAAGVDVRTAACNQAGDITDSAWTCDYDTQPFSDKFVLVGGVL
jgi:hypothetical protein